MTSVGDVANTSDPVPVSSVTAVLKFALLGVARNVAIPLPSPETPVDTGSPVQFVKVPLVGVPRTGAIRVGVSAKTAAPTPVSSVRALLRLALDGVAKNVATPVPNPEMPVESGRPVQFVSVPDVGVPRIGVTNVGVFANTKAPLPVSSEITVLSSAEVVEANADSLLDPVARVPEVGSVTLVDPVVVSVTECPPT